MSERTTQNVTFVQTPRAPVVHRVQHESDDTSVPNFIDTSSSCRIYDVISLQFKFQNE